VAIVFADSDDYPAIADETADFVYARLQRTSEDEPAGYPDSDLDAWAERTRTWSDGGAPEDLPRFGEARAKKVKRDVFAFMIAGAKVRAPHAAMALIERVK